MSSGAYVVEVPAAMLGMAFSAVGEAWDAAVDSMDRNLEIQQQIREVNAEYQRVRESVDAVLADIHTFQESLKNLNFHYYAESTTFRNREAGESVQAFSSLDLSDLMFMEVDIETQEVTYVVLDYSGTISPRNAKNSAQFKKLALASDLMKNVMLWVVDDIQEQMRLNQLIGVVNQLLDDDTIAFDHFRQFVDLRFEAFHRQQQAMEYDTELWQQYCALCAMCGERPKRIHRDALAREVQKIKSNAATAKYVANARKTFMEAVEQLGLEVQSDYVLDRVSGTLLVDLDNPGFNLFFSEHDVSFLLEMVDTGEADPDQRIQQRTNVCHKRRQLEQFMREKGYHLKICAEDDAMCAKLTGVQEKKEAAESRSEQLRRRRALAGKQAKLKMAGGK